LSVALHLYFYQVKLSEWHLKNIALKQVLSHLKKTLNPINLTDNLSKREIKKIHVESTVPFDLASTSILSQLMFHRTKLNNS